MTKRILQKAFMTMTVAMLSMFAYAQQNSYKVLYCNSDRIRIGDSIAKKGLVFDDEKKIVMPKDDCVIEYQDLNNGKVKQMVGNEAKKRKAKTLKEYLLAEKVLRTKGLGDNDPIVFDTVFYMLDTLRVPAPWHVGGATKTKVVAQIGDGHIEAYATRSKDGMEYIVTRSDLRKHDGKPFTVDFLEIEIEKNWESAVWRKLYVIPLPLKIE